MSTYLYLVCEHHDEPVTAEDESGQHFYDLPQLRFDWLNREHWLAYIERFPDALTRDWDHLSYFQRHTFWFLREHAGCGTPVVVSEYGDRFPIEAPTIDALMSATPYTPDKCHCGQSVVYGYDGDPTHHRGMCKDCDPVRCDAHPGACRNASDKQ